ncbi:helix-turn-helix domain-containing protein [Zobellella sp. An-6]|uniref:helix-turn-helix domain-containing protein n=1 Tax=Zobellella sp. An-6 TaxID=3400218 RepID=UPI004041FE50
MKITSAKQLGTHLRDARLSENLSQGKVAGKVGIRQDTVSNFELNTTKLDTFFKILSALNLELEVKPRGAKNVDLDSSQDWKEEW